MSVGRIKLFATNSIMRGRSAVNVKLRIAVPCAWPGFGAAWITSSCQMNCLARARSAAYSFALNQPARFVAFRNFGKLRNRHRQVTVLCMVEDLSNQAQIALN